MKENRAGWNEDPLDAAGGDFEAGILQWTIPDSPHDCQIISLKYFSEARVGP